jgi:hypothetical protein
LTPIFSRSYTIAHRIREVFLNGHWIANTNFKDQLQSISYHQATQTIYNINSIAALTFHINYYLQGLLNAFETGKLEISDKYSFDMPELINEADWSILVTLLLTNAEKFANSISQLDDSVFDDAFIDPKYGTFLRNIEGVLEHSYYHLGQIVLIKKIIGA